MIKLTYTILLTISFALSFANINAEEVNVNEKQLITVNLKYITGEDVLSVLKSLIDESVSISNSNNVLLINGTPDKTKNILHIINEIDTPHEPLTIEFIASNKKLDFQSADKTYRTVKNNISQSMAITERQWVTLNTAMSVPISERKRYADGTETQSFRYKKINKSYVFKVHEFSGWSVIQVGVNISTPASDVAGIIKHTKLDTTIVGKTGEWLEVASSRAVTENNNSQTYSTNKNNQNYIHLYVKVKKPEIKTESETKITQ